MLRIPHYLDILLTADGKVISLMYQLPFTPQKQFIFYFCPWYYFLLEAKLTPGHSVAIRIR
jgi:hypothetical protein